MLLDKNTAKNQLFLANRLVFEEGGRSEGGTPEKFESQNLKEISETVKESFLQRQQLKEGIDLKIRDIQGEMADHKRVVDQLYQRVLNEKPKNSISQDFLCLGQSVTVTMDPAGKYEESVQENGQKKSINFLSWAIEQKNKQKNNNVSE